MGEAREGMAAEDADMRALMAAEALAAERAREAGECAAMALEEEWQALVASGIDPVTRKRVKRGAGAGGVGGRSRIASRITSAMASRRPTVTATAGAGTGAGAGGLAAAVAGAFSSKRSSVAASRVSGNSDGASATGPGGGALANAAAALGSPSRPT